MKRPGIRVRDRLAAEALSYGSAIGQKFPKMAALTGQAPDVRWMFMRGTPATDIEEWHDFPGNPSSGILPLHYHDTVVVSFNKEAFDACLGKEGGRKALAYVLGETAIMAGFSDEREIFGSDPENPERYAVATRIGDGALHTTVGIVLPGDREFLVPSDLQIMAKRGAPQRSVNIPIL
jgi:hypothetical protein